MQDPDPRTLARAREGDLRAFEELVRLHQADVYRFARHLTHDPPTAEDVTQETFLRAFRSLPSYRGEARFGSWLLRIARNCAMDALRTRRALLARTTGPPAPAPPADAVARTELAAALMSLDDDHRELFLLVEVLGLSYREAADVLGLRLGTVKSRMHRARKAMVRALAVEEDAGGL